MTQTIRNQYLSDLIDYDEDGSSSDGPNDIEITRMISDNNLHRRLSRVKQSHFEYRMENMRDILVRIGHQRPKCFAAADLHQDFSDTTT